MASSVLIVGRTMMHHVTDPHVRRFVRLTLASDERSRERIACPRISAQIRHRYSNITYHITRANNPFPTNIHSGFFVRTMNNADASSLVGHDDDHVPSEEGGRAAIFLMAMASTFNVSSCMSLVISMELTADIFSMPLPTVIRSARTDDVIQVVHTVMRKNYNLAIANMHTFLNVLNACRTYDLRAVLVSLKSPREGHSVVMFPCMRHGGEMTWTMCNSWGTLGKCKNVFNTMRDLIAASFTELVDFSLVYVR